MTRPVLHHRTDVATRRRAEYPPAGDALDAIMKALAAQAAAGVELPAETVAWIEECRAVKARFRKDTHADGQ